jgi:hypothetical protein
MEENSPAKVCQSGHRGRPSGWMCRLRAAIRLAHASIPCHADTRARAHIRAHTSVIYRINAWRCVSQQSLCSQCGVVCGAKRVRMRCGRERRRGRLTMMDGVCLRQASLPTQWSLAVRVWFHKEALVTDEVHRCNLHADRRGNLWSTVRFVLVCDFVQGSEGSGTGTRWWSGVSMEPLGPT